MPLGRLSSLEAMDLLMAKPTPDTHGSKDGQSCQKNAYRAAISESCPSATLSAAISTLDLVSSLATSGVPLVAGLLHKG